MYRLEDVEQKVREFAKREFPEIWDDVKDTGFFEEFAAVIFDMLTGEEDEHAAS